MSRIKDMKEKMGGSEATRSEAGSVTSTFKKPASEESKPLGTAIPLDLSKEFDVYAAMSPDKKKEIVAKALSEYMANHPVT